MLNKKNKKATLSVDNYLNEAISHHKNNFFEKAEKIYLTIIQKEPNHFDALQLLATLNAQLGKLNESLDLFNRAISINNKDSSIFNNRGNVFKELKKNELALKDYEQSIQLNPQFADPYYNMGVINQELNLMDKAHDCYKKAIKLNPFFTDAFNNLGVVLQKIGRYEESIEIFKKILEQNNTDFRILNGLGNSFRGIHNYDMALECFKKATLLNPNSAESFNNLAVSYQNKKEYSLAQEAYEQALKIDPFYTDAIFNKAILLEEMGLLEEALIEYENVLLKVPDKNTVHLNKGNTLKKLRRYQDSIKSYEECIKLQPNSFDAYNNLGVVYQELKLFNESYDSFSKAIEIAPENYLAYLNRGGLLKEAKKFKEALDDYEKVIALNPNAPYVLGERLYIKMLLCDWENLEIYIKELIEGIYLGQKVSPSFPLVAFEDSCETQKLASVIWSNDKFPENQFLGNIVPREKTPSSKIKIGYFSADFHNHATAYLMAELFELHDKNRFEIYGFSFGPNQNDEMRNRIQNAFDHFFDVSLMSDMLIAQLSRTLEIDIAIDLKGFTFESRPGIFAHRAAPIQVNYLGYPGTMGCEYIDYLIADRTIIPEESRKFYTEKILYMPDCYQINDRKREIANNPITKYDYGLPQDQFIFCSFNNNYKIMPQIFDSWMRILKTIPNSILWLLQDTENVVSNLRREASIRNVDPSRLYFAPRVNLADHLARHRFVDLFLDTFPCNAHTTASDALWTGLPVLTLTGESFSSRVAASLLKNIGTPELITHSFAEYENLAILLASKPDLLSSIKNKIVDGALNSKLFDSKLFTLNLESVYKDLIKERQDLFIQVCD
jgi:predicted O-linked N-acetylglucosamine transferase (SPINDLY family)